MADLEDYSVGTDIIAQDLALLAIDIAAQTLSAMKVNITAQDLAKVAIDVVAQTLSAMKVDITAQTLASLAVDITTQTIAALKVNITTQDLTTLAVSIAAQTLGSLIIKIGAVQTVSVDTFRDWQSQQGKVKAVTGSRINSGAVVTYTVTAGKTLYLLDWGGSGTAVPTLYYLDVDGASVRQYYQAANVILLDLLSTPLKLAAGQVVTVYVSGAAGTYYGNLLGIEV